MMSLKANLTLIARRLPGCKLMPVFNGYDRYIIYFPDMEDETKEGLIDIISGNHIVDFTHIKREVAYVMEIIPDYISTSELVWDLLPDFSNIEYNIYMRLPFSINSNTKKLCVPLDEDSYKI
jgi:hypothetical protein